MKGKSEGGLKVENCFFFFVREMIFGLFLSLVIREEEEFSSHLLCNPRSPTLENEGKMMTFGDNKSPGIDPEKKKLRELPVISGMEE